MVPTLVPAFMRWCLGEHLRAFYREWLTAPLLQYVWLWIAVVAAIHYTSQCLLCRACCHVCWTCHCVLVCRAAEGDPSVIFKDLDVDLRIVLEQPAHDKLMAQLAADCELLRCGPLSSCPAWSGSEGLESTVMQHRSRNNAGPVAGTMQRHCVWCACCVLHTCGCCTTACCWMCATCNLPYVASTAWLGGEGRLPMYCPADRPAATGPVCGCFDVIVHCVSHRSVGVMDYSLLLGVHYPTRHFTRASLEAAPSLSLDGTLPHTSPLPGGTLPGVLGVWVSSFGHVCHGNVVVYCAWSVGVCPLRTAWLCCGVRRHLGLWCMLHTSC
jgi:hypothetical protein